MVHITYFAYAGTIPENEKELLSEDQDIKHWLDRYNAIQMYFNQAFIRTISPLLL